MSRQAEYKKIYIQESGELLQQMNNNLLILEKDPANEAALNAIFRSAHTLKSMSASMGHTKSSDLAHKMEDVLSQIRNNTISVSENIVNLLFQSFDNLEKMVEFVQSDKEFTRDISGLLSALDNIMVKKQEFKEEKVSDDLSLNKFEKRVLARSTKGGFTAYLVKVTLDKACVLKSVRAFMVFRNLHNIGEVIKSIPDSRSLEEEKFEQGFSCIFITQEKKAIVKKNVLEILDVESVAVENVQVDLDWDKESPEEKAAAAAYREEELQAVGEEHLRKIQSVRVDITRLDKLMNLVEELAVNKLRLTEIGVKTGNRDLAGVIEDLNHLTDDLQDEVMQARLVPVGQVFDRFPRMVRDLAKKEGKSIRFDVMGADIELDRTVLDEIGDSLIHLIRNSIDHGIETPQERKLNGKPEEAQLILAAKREKSHVFIEVADDGRGMDIEKIKKAAIEKGIISEEELLGMSQE